MKSDNLSIKYHRNRFIRFLLKTMRRTVENRALQRDYYVNLVRHKMTIKTQLNKKNYSHLIAFVQLILL